MEDEAEVHDLSAADDMATDDPQPGTPSGFSCPECNGVLWEQTTEGDLTHFRCRIGHAYSEDSLIAEHSESLEAALSAAHRALEEHAALVRRTAARLRHRGHSGAAARFERQAADAVQHANVVQSTIRTLEAPPEPRAEGAAG